MKRLKFVTVMAVLATITFGIMTLVACSKDEDHGDSINHTNLDKTQIFENWTYQDIDLLSQDVANLHDYEVNRLMNDEYFASINSNKDLAIYVVKNILSDYSSINLPYLNQYGIDSISTDNIVNILNATDAGVSNIGGYLTLCEGIDSILNVTTIDDKEVDILDTLYSTFDRATTFHEFDSLYHAGTISILSVISSKEDYMCLRLYADVAYGSFWTWCEVLYGNDTKRNTWNKIKNAASNAWTTIRPYAKADAQGAVAGAAASMASAGVSTLLGGPATGAATIAGATAGGAVANSLIKYASTH